MRDPHLALLNLSDPSPIAGDPSALRFLANRLADCVRNLEAYGTQVGMTSQFLASNSSRTVRAVDNFLFTRALLPSTALLNAVREAERATLAHALEVEQIHAEARVVLMHAEEWRATVNPITDIDRTNHEGAKRLETDWIRLRDERMASESRFVAALDAAVAGVMPSRQTKLDWGSGIRVASLDSVTDQSGRMHSRLEALYRSQLFEIAIHGAPDAAAVHQWWSQLPARERREVIEGHHAMIGNLDGVPIDARVRANSVSARGYLLETDISADEASYWSKVVNGSVKLVVCDPSESRFVEMIGTPSEQTQAVVTYVPGTGAQPRHFFAGEVQQVSEHMEKYTANESVVFVYKDGPWVSWAGENSNTNYEFLSELGGRVADFQSRVIQLDPHLAGLSEVAMGHSAGMSVISGAEMAGAHYELVVSLGGSYMLEGWMPDEQTSYRHFQYDNDVINRIDGGRLHTPHELDEVYAQRIFHSEGQSEMRSHSRIAEGRETNESALNSMAREIDEMRKIWKSNRHVTI